MSPEGTQLISGPGHFVWDRELPLKRSMQAGKNMMFELEAKQTCGWSEIKTTISDLYRSNDLHWIYILIYEIYNLSNHVKHCTNLYSGPLALNPLNFVRYPTCFWNLRPSRAHCKIHQVSLPSLCLSLSWKQGVTTWCSMEYHQCTHTWRACAISLKASILRASDGASMPILWWKSSRCSALTETSHLSNFRCQHCIIQQSNCVIHIWSKVSWITHFWWAEQITAVQLLRSKAVLSRLLIAVHAFRQTL